jgi:hypothetical protein
MKKPLLLLACLALLASTASAEKLDLGEGKAALLTVPDGWKAAAMPAGPSGLPAMGTNVRYVTKSGSNDAIIITLLAVPDDRFAEEDNLKAMIEESTQQFAAGSVEGKAVLKDFKVAGHSGYCVAFTDANLVGKPSVKEDYKTLTSCFVYLGDKVMLTATIFTDDLNGKPYTEAFRLLKSVSLSSGKGAL